jgi:predicted O-methyltransferase YrrM
MAKKQVDDSIEVASLGRLEDIEQFIIDAGSDSLAVFGGTYEGGVHVQQIPDEFAAMVFDLILSGRAITDYLEIGAAAGGTTYIINHYFRPRRIVVIDDNLHCKANLRQGILEGVERREIIGNSHDQSVIDQAAGEYDLIIIDGEHSYSGAMADVNNYLPFLNECGFLVLHDSVTRSWACAVPDVVADLKGDERVTFINEYISKTHPQPCGIAVFRKAVE